MDTHAMGPLKTSMRAQKTENNKLVCGQYGQRKKEKRKKKIHPLLDDVVSQ
jgi:hypothetical protein